CAPRWTASRPSLAFLERFAPRRSTTRKPRRLHSQSPREDFSGSPFANGHGLLAFSNSPLRLRWQQPRSRRQQLVFPVAGVARSNLHRFRRAAVLAQSLPWISFVNLRVLGGKALCRIPQNPSYC